MALVAASLFGPIPPSRVTRANYGLIVQGMSRAEVDNVLGGPPGVHSTRPVWTPRSIMLDRPPGGTRFQWIGDEADVCVSFDSTGHVVDKDIYDIPSQDRGSLANIVWRIEQRWRRLFP